MKPRESGADMIRCLAFVFVVVFHCFLYSGYYSTPQRGAAMVVWGGLRWLSVSCIGLFAMLSGYLKGQQSPGRCLKSLGPVVLGYLLAAGLSIPIRHWVWADRQSLRVWVCRLISFEGVSYGWYAEMYIGLVVLMPLMNLGMAQLTSRQLLWLAGGLLCITALPGATPLRLAPDHWCGIYPVTYYVLGACVRRFQPKPRPVAALAAALGVALGLGLVTTCSTQGDLGHAFTQTFGDLWIAVIAVCLFAGLYRLRLSGWLARALAWAAGGCYGGYLLSPLVERWVYRLFPRWRSPQTWGWLLLCGGVSVLLISLVSGKLLDGLTRRLLRAGRSRGT